MLGSVEAWKEMANKGYIFCAIEGVHEKRGGQCGKGMM